MKVIISGGGTAGHINPGISIAKEILKVQPTAEILFVGTNHGIEKDLVPKEGFKLEFINVKGFKRKISFDTLVSVKELCQGLFQAKRLLKHYKPDIVIGTGGYVCGPVLFNAKMMGIRTFIHEQNAYPGVTNRILSKIVDTVFISFEESRKYFSAKNVILTGNPIRPEIINADRDICRQKLNITDKKLLVVFGGSLGAQKINDMMIRYIKSGISKGIKVVFGTGAKDYDRVIKILEGDKINSDNIEILPYIENMAEVLPAGDLIVCRAGAITLSEITALGIPSILIPSPNVTHNHQEYNARALEKNNCAKVLLEKDIESTDFKEYVETLISDDNQLAKMSENAKIIGIRDSAEKIVRVILTLTPSPSPEIGRGGSS